MAGYLDALKQHIGVFGTGLMLELAPGMASGIINELFHHWKVDVAKITQDVQNDRSLWSGIPPDQRKQLKNLARRIGNLNFITPDFIINSIKKDFPGVASLFLNYDEAKVWLTEQIEIMKREVQE